jgi:DNA-binding transcriptional regulator YiaG
VSVTGQDIKREREKLGLTQGQFAAVLGVAENTVWRWEAGERHPHPIVLKAVQTALRDLKARGKTAHEQERNG